MYFIYAITIIINNFNNSIPSLNVFPQVIYEVVLLGEVATILESSIFFFYDIMEL